MEQGTFPTTDERRTSSSPEEALSIHCLNSFDQEYKALLEYISEKATSKQEWIVVIM